jgi:beta-lactamase superfamily II metal-dependent hydrolase
MSYWTLKIHQIDVGQGESTLIVARNLATGEQRSMLIDGGIHGCGPIVHAYVAENTYGMHLDHIVVSHYDTDHSGGVAALLTADNLYAVAQTIAFAAGTAVAAAASVGESELAQASAGAAAAMAAAMGAYSPGDFDRKKDLSKIADSAGEGAADSLFAGITKLDDAAKAGSKFGRDYVQSLLDAGRKINRSILPNKPSLREKVCVAASLAAVGNAILDPVGSARDEILKRLYPKTKPEGARFDTGGIYANVNIIDTGKNLANEKDDYIKAVGGNVFFGDIGIRAPLFRRKRSTPPLEEEVLWGRDRNGRQVAPIGAPWVFLLAANRDIAGSRNAIGFGEEGNGTSIGLIVQFNNFYFYTGGDLPSDGEDAIWRYVQRNFPTNHICCFKCGHHGSKTSSSDEFVDGIKASAALISVGQNDKFKHPDREVIDRLQGSATIKNFYLTNLRYDRKPAATWPNNPFSPGRGLVAGDNNSVNLASGRMRGNITVYVDQDSSLSKIHPGDPGCGGKVNHRFVVEFENSATRLQIMHIHNH